MNTQGDSGWTPVSSGELPRKRKSFRYLFLNSSNTEWVIEHIILVDDTTIKRFFEHNPHYKFWSQDADFPPIPPTLDPDKVREDNAWKRYKADHSNESKHEHDWREGYRAGLAAQEGEK